MDDHIEDFENFIETMADDFIQIVYAEFECKFETPKERVNNVWLYKAVNQ